VRAGHAALVDGASEMDAVAADLADTRHAGAAGARSYYEIKFRGPDHQEFDVTESGWITG